MANQEQLEILKQGVDVWNKWREEKHKVKIDLSDTNLSETDLKKVDFSGADLSSANLSKANLHEANLFGTILDGTDFFEANLVSAKFEGSLMIGTNLTKANLTGSTFGETVLVNINFHETEGLDTITHFFRSSISTASIYFPVPEIFLRGCGLSDSEIEFAKLSNPNLDSEQVTDIIYKIHQLRLGGGVQYYSCFISYSSKDQEFAQLLHDDLQNNGVRCWFDREDMKIGDSIRPTVDRQIRLRDKLLVILSENSIKSEWVGDEVEGALEEEQKGNRSVLFPIRLDDTALNTRDDWVAKIKRRRHIGDFSNWKDRVSYQKVFERLLRDLRATGGQVNGE